MEVHFNEILEKIRAKVLSFCITRLKDLHNAEDMVQQVLTELLISDEIDMTKTEAEIQGFVMSRFKWRIKDACRVCQATGINYIRETSVTEGFWGEAKHQYDDQSEGDLAASDFDFYQDTFNPKEKGVGCASSAGFKFRVSASGFKMAMSALIKKDAYANIDYVLLRDQLSGHFQGKDKTIFLMLTDEKNDSVASNKLIKDDIATMFKISRQRVEQIIAEKLRPNCLRLLGAEA